MEILATTRIENELKKLYASRGLNQYIALCLTNPLFTNDVKFSFDALGGAATMSVIEHFANAGVSYSADEAVIFQVVYEILRQTDPDSPNVVLPPVLLDDIVRSGRVFHEGELEANPYYKNIHFDDVSGDNFSLSHNVHEKGEVFIFDSAKCAIPGIMLPRIGMFDYDFKYPCIIQEGQGVWMSVSPSEIFTMQGPINQASGNVLTLGCGMGYFAYMASLKDSVSHVTIVEKEPAVINLFKTHILPQFSNPDKITIIQADAFEYMEALEDGKFDFCFADIWISNMDSQPYMKMKRLCRKFRKMRMSYWIEKNIIGTMNGLIYTIIMKAYYKAKDIPIPGIEMAAVATEEETFKDEMAFFEEGLRDTKITRPEQISYIMDCDNIANLL